MSSGAGPSLLSSFVCSFVRPSVTSVTQGDEKIQEGTDTLFTKCKNGPLNGTLLLWGACSSSVRAFRMTLEAVWQGE